MCLQLLTNQIKKEIFFFLKLIYSKVNFFLKKYLKRLTTKKDMVNSKNFFIR